MISMIPFSELLKKGYSLHQRIYKEGKTDSIVITNPNGDFEYYIKVENGKLIFEKHTYNFASNNQEHISKMLKSLLTS